MHAFQRTVERQHRDTCLLAMVWQGDCWDLANCTLLFGLCKNAAFKAFPLGIVASRLSYWSMFRGYSQIASNRRAIDSLHCSLKASRVLPARLIAADQYLLYYLRPFMKVVIIVQFFIMEDSWTS